MTKHTPDLFKNRSTTQEFLFSHSDDIIDHGDSQEVSAGRDDATSAPLGTLFPDMLDRQGLARAIATHMASAATLVAMAVRIDWPAAKRSDDGKETDIAQDTLTPIATFCRAHDGTWARIGRARIACVFPHLSKTDGQVLAQGLLNVFSDARLSPVNIGLAAYPTTNYARSQIVKNSEKALEHADFFGPGTITGFDAVSLNISGDRHYQAGDVTGAIDEYKRGLLLDPVDVNLHNSLGVCYGVLKDYDNALTAFENAIWLAPEEIMAIYNKGYILLLKGRQERALECFLEADTREPNVFEVVFHIGQTFMEMGATEKARPYIEEATHTNSRSGPAFKSLGACLNELGLTKEAIQAYKRAVKINPVDAESLSALGRLYVHREESPDVAAVLCEQSVRLSPDNGLFRHRLGHAYLHQGKLDHALAEFERAEGLGHDSQAQIDATQGRMMAAKAS